MSRADDGARHPEGRGHSTLRARMIDGTARVFLAEALIVPTGLATVAFLTRRLGPAEYGRYTLAVALITWIEWGMAAPFGRAAVRLVASAADWRPIASLMIRTELAVGALTAVALAVAAPRIADVLGDSELALLLQLIALDLPLFALSQAHQQVLVALGRFRARAMVSLARWTVRFALIVVAVETGLSTPGVVMAIVATSAAEVALARFLVRPPLFQRSRVSVGMLFEYAGPLLATAMCLRLFERLDVVLLKALGRPEADVGVYGAAQSLTIAASLFTTSFSPLLLSTVTKAVAAGDWSHARELARDAVRAVVLLLPFAAILSASAPDAVPLVFGAHYTAGIRVFQYLIFAALMNIVVSVGCALLIGAGWPRRTLMVALPLPLMAVVGHRVAIPLYGPEGAALVTMSCAAVGAALALTANYRLWRVALPFRSAARSLAVAIAAGAFAAAWPAPGALVIVKVVVVSAGAAFGLFVTGEFGQAKEVGATIRRLFAADAAASIR